MPDDDTVHRSVLRLNRVQVDSLPSRLELKSLWKRSPTNFVPIPSQGRVLSHPVHTICNLVVARGPMLQEGIAWTHGVRLDMGGPPIVLLNLIPGADAR